MKTITIEWEAPLKDKNVYGDVAKVKGKAFCADGNYLAKLAKEDSVSSLSKISRITTDDPSPGIFQYSATGLTSNQSILDSLKDLVGKEAGFTISWKDENGAVVEKATYKGTIIDYAVADCSSSPQSDITMKEYTLVMQDNFFYKANSIKKANRIFAGEDQNLKTVIEKVFQETKLDAPTWKVTPGADSFTVQVCKQTHETNYNFIRRLCAQAGWEILLNTEGKVVISNKADYEEVKDLDSKGKVNNISLVYKGKKPDFSKVEVTARTDKGSIVKKEATINDHLDGRTNIECPCEINVQLREVKNVQILEAMAKGILHKEQNSPYFIFGKTEHIGLQVGKKIKGESLVLNASKEKNIKSKQFVIVGLNFVAENQSIVGLAPSEKIAHSAEYIAAPLGMYFTPSFMQTSASEEYDAKIVTKDGKDTGSVPAKEVLESKLQQYAQILNDEVTFKALLSTPPAATSLLKPGDIVKVRFPRTNSYEDLPRIVSALPIKDAGGEVLDREKDEDDPCSTFGTVHTKQEKDLFNYMKTDDTKDKQFFTFYAPHTMVTHVKQKRQAQVGGDKIEEQKNEKAKDFLKIDGGSVINCKDLYSITTTEKDAQITSTVAEGKYLITCKEAVITVKEKMTITCENLEVKAKDSMKFVADKDISIDAKGNLNLSSGKNTSITAKGTMSSTATGKNSISGQDVNVEGKVNCNLQAVNANVTAKANATLKANAKAAVEGSAMTAISGGIIKAG
ncbi:hypothetical protein [Candidatus Sneabacter namystus]|uniref:Gp5/Type VI secretion system Vgr protein OB-fold domain-containing protein n=1 Tax=Candidatus Sneabacter namystus TaxID=2601646 RepID=A0A5C0UJV0_9RICK|nr:hypothetical protein [Candidatus Sneabacter namystus]QEK39901.1 hypothetical protein FZC37_03060 [Candidatus Sneabacter namystus]